MIHCQLILGELEDAEQQLEMLQAVHDSADSSPELAFLEALLADKKDRTDGEDLKVSLLDQVVARHRTRVQETTGVNADALEKMATFNPEFMLDIARSFLARSTAEFDLDLPSSAIPPAVRKGIDVLADVTARVPGSTQAHLMRFFLLLRMTRCRDVIIIISLFFFFVGRLSQPIMDYYYYLNNYHNHAVAYVG